MSGVHIASFSGQQGHILRTCRAILNGQLLVTSEAGIPCFARLLAMLFQSEL